MEAGFGVSANKSETNFDQNSETSFQLFGGDPKMTKTGSNVTDSKDSAKQVNKWIKSVADFPWFFGGVSRPISKLIKNLAKREQVQNAIQATMHQAFLKQLDGQVEHSKNIKCKDINGDELDHTTLKSYIKIVADRTVPAQGEVYDLKLLVEECTGTKV